MIELLEGHTKPFDNVPSYTIKSDDQRSAGNAAQADVRGS
jgi:hypothetical protein